MRNLPSKLPNKLPPALIGTLKRWIWRLAIAAVILSLIGLFSSPAVMPLMCKIYG